jgi:hypothetical protein
VSPLTPFSSQAHWPVSHGQLQNLRKERLTFLDSTILRNINLEDLIPMEVDDEHIFEDKIVPQQGVPLTSGFNIHSRVFWCSLGSEEKDQDIRGRLHTLKYILDSIPQELRQWGTAGGQFACLRANLHITHLWLQILRLDQVEDVDWIERGRHRPPNAACLTQHSAREPGAERIASGKCSSPVSGF